MYMWPLDILDRGLFLPSSHPLEPALARRVLAVLRRLEAKHHVEGLRVEQEPAEK